MEDLPSMKFTWTIENFSSFNTKKHYSDVFVVGGYKWRILIFPKGNGVDHLSLYLDVADSIMLPYGWRRYAQFSLAVVNQIHSKYSIRKGTKHQFTSRESDWGFTSFMPLHELYDAGRGFLVNNMVIVEAEVTSHEIQDFPPQPKESIGESASPHKSQTQLAPQKSLNHVVEVLDEDFEKEILSKLELLADLPMKEPATPGKGKAVLGTEPKEVIEIPTQEEINLATSILQSLIKSNPSLVCQELDKKAILEAAQTLSRAASLPAFHRQFWTDFPSTLQDFSQEFNDKQNIVAEAMLAQKKTEDKTTALIFKREEYLKTKAEHALQSKEYQDLLSEMRQLEARLAELRNLIPEKKSSVDVLTNSRSKLLKELDAEGKQIMEEKKRAGDLAEAAKLASEDVKQLKKEWESWKDLLH